MTRFPGGQIIQTICVPATLSVIEYFKLGKFSTFIFMFAQKKSEARWLCDIDISIQNCL